MRDGITQEVPRSPNDGDFENFCSRYQATVVIVRGPSAGEQFEVDRATLTLGRGPEVDREFDDPSMSAQHAAIEYVNGGFRLRDLGSTNGMMLNGGVVNSAELKHGDRFQLGAQEFQFVIEEVEDAPEVYELDVD
jgi:pSer/pThr/pTyr-binding forkhead associated (FHA) protein